MVSCITMALLTLTYFAFVTHRALAKVAVTVFMTWGISRINILDKCTDYSFKVFWAFLRTIHHQKRSSIWLLKRQNDPAFEADIKLFFGDILGLDNNSPYIDLDAALKMDFSSWRKRYRNTVNRFAFRLKRGEYARLSLSDYLRLLANKFLLVIKASIKLSFILVSVIKYIHHNGGLTNYAK